TRRRGQNLLTRPAVWRVGGNHYREIGGARRDRTVDLLHAMQALSQLSYSPISWTGRILGADRRSVNEIFICLMKKFGIRTITYRKRPMRRPHPADLVTTKVRRRLVIMPNLPHHCMIQPAAGRPSGAAS